MSLASFSIFDYKMGVLNIIHTDGAQPWIYIVLILLCVALITSVVISFYLYKWRRLLINDTTYLTPEEWGESIQTLGKEVRSIEKKIGKNLTALSSQSDTHSKKISDMTETYMSLQSALTEKDEEILRLKGGYDAYIFHKFLFRFIRIDQALKDYAESEDYGLEIIEQLSELFEDALDECGVEYFTPPVGEDYRHITGVAKNPKKIHTEIAEDHFKIAKVIERGYKLRNTDIESIIVPAKVNIFIYEENKLGDQA